VGSHLGEQKAKNKHGQEIRVEKDLLPQQVGSTQELFPKQCPLVPRKHGNFIHRDYTYSGRRAL
jgi:hypothetical protein